MTSALVKVGHIAREELHVGAADTDSLQSTTTSLGGRRRAGTSCTRHPRRVQNLRRMLRVLIWQSLFPRPGAVAPFEAQQPLPPQGLDVRPEPVEGPRLDYPAPPSARKDL